MGIRQVLLLRNQLRNLDWRPRLGNRVANLVTWHDVALLLDVLRLSLVSLVFFLSHLDIGEEPFSMASCLVVDGLLLDLTAMASSRLLLIDSGPFGRAYPRSVLRNTLLLVLHLIDVQLPLSIELSVPFDRNGRGGRRPFTGIDVYRLGDGEA